MPGRFDAGWIAYRLDSKPGGFHARVDWMRRCLAWIRFLVVFSDGWLGYASGFGAWVISLPVGWIRLPHLRKLGIQVSSAPKYRLLSSGDDTNSVKFERPTSSTPIQYRVDGLRWNLSANL